MFRAILLWFLLLPLVADAKVATFQAQDTLDPPAPDTPEERQALSELAWTPDSFPVTATTEARGPADATLFFPSPHPSGEAAQDRVPIEWYAARDEQGEAIEAPAVLVVHSLHPAMPIGRAAARALAARGYHAFLIHLPGYGLRTEPDPGPIGVTALLHGTQAVADIRRARDALLALPNVRRCPVALVGVSLGGFAAATAAGLDPAFDPVMLVLAGG